MDAAIFRVMNNLQSYMKGRKSLMRNYKADKYYENSMPYLIFYDKSEFKSELNFQQGGANVDEAPIDVNDIRIGSDDDEKSLINVTDDPDMIKNIVNEIDENREEFEKKLSESQEEGLTTRPDTIIEKEVGEKMVKGITVDNVTVSSGEDTMNAKVLKKDGSTLCIILQKTAKAVRDIVALTLVNSIRLNLFYVERSMRERIHTSKLQLSSEEYDKIGRDLRGKRIIPVLENGETVDSYQDYRFYGNIMVFILF
jgi:hypothetical protein